MNAMLLYLNFALNAITLALIVVILKVVHENAMALPLDHHVDSETQVRLGQLASVLERIDRASVGAQLTAQELAVDLDADRKLAEGVARHLKDSQAQAKAVPESAAPGEAADAGSRGPDGD